MYGGVEAEPLCLTYAAQHNDVCGAVPRDVRQQLGFGPPVGRLPSVDPAQPHRPGLPPPQGTMLSGLGFKHPTSTQNDGVGPFYLPLWFAC